MNTLLCSFGILYKFCINLFEIEKVETPQKFNLADLYKIKYQYREF
ncbi:hypothetical protein LEP1GSC024_2175 [Leptospira noguchii str. 2001034031]|uniref:Uncharacterized protein n=1 Tax=Leptospira noguchii str. 2001034031 TaxID=1193053 RepID=M6Y793_9LEPT|nr:hypothetical protein LEP1GSC024_2175 [Leptospira noguchii str. 2001034031]